MPKILAIGKHHWKTILYYVPAGAFITVILVYLSNIYKRSPTEFLTRADFIIASIAAVLVGITAILVLRTLELTRKSLELTRATTRPFLTYSKFGMHFPGNAAAIHMWICNTGIHPADNVKVDIVVYTPATEDDGEKILNLPRTDSALFFPNKELIFTSVVNPEHVSLIKTGKVWVRINIVYLYKLTGTEHKTVQVGRIVKVKSGLSDYIFVLDADKSYWT